MNNVLKYSVITGLFASLLIPLFVADSLYFPFITGKGFFFRIVVEITFTLWLVLALRDRSYIPKWNWVLGVVSLFTLATLVSNLLGISPLKSLWSNYERMEGWMMVVHLLAYFIALSGTLRSRREWHWFMNTSMAVAGITSIHALSQYFGFTETHQGIGRLDASLGNSAYFAVYMSVHIFMAIYLYFIARLNEIKGSRYLRWIYLLAIVVFVFVLFETGTRGAILGFAGGVIASALMLVIRCSGKVRILGASAIALIAIAGVLIYAGRNTDFVKNIPNLNRLASISISETKSQARQFIWPMAIKGAFEGPKTAIIGWGQENFNYIFNEHYNPLMYAHEKWFDRAHSVYLDWLVAGGIVGLGLYLALYVLALVYIARSDLSIYKKSALVGLLVAYGIHNIFVFDNLTSYVLFFAFLAFVSHLRGGKDIAVLSNMKINPDVANYAIAPSVGVLAVAAIITLNIIPIRANRTLIMAMQSCAPDRINPELYEKALDTSPFLGKQETREQAIFCAMSIVPRKEVSEEKRQAMYSVAKRAIDEQIASTPEDARGYYFGGIFYGSVGKFDEAVANLDKAVSLSPAKHEFLQSLGNAYMNTGKVDEGLVLFKKSHDSAPEYLDSTINYATALAYAKKYSDLAVLAESNLDAVIHQNTVSVLAENKRYDLIIALYKKSLEMNPGNVDIMFPLAATYLKAGNRSLSVETLRKAAELNPSLKDQIDTLIKDIQSGKEIPVGI